jgi:uncharacterized surface protein with fasciclin (FAS1) repeats
VVAGKYDSKALMSLIKKGHGTAMLKTVSGGTLTLMTGDMNGMMSKGIMIKDEKGGMANVTIADVRQSNGVIHVIDSVLMPS